MVIRSILNGKNLFFISRNLKIYYSIIIRYLRVQKYNIFCIHHTKIFKKMKKIPNTLKFS